MVSARRSSDLPILDELGIEFRRLVAAELRAGAPVPSPPVERAAASPRVRIAPARRRPGDTRRVVRRATIVLVLVGLVGTGALAAGTRLGGSGRTSDSAPALLGVGPGWKLSAHRHDGKLCLLFEGAGDLADACDSDPAVRGVQATSFVGPGTRYVAGLAGRAVVRVRVHVAGVAVDAATQMPVDPAAAAATGAPRGMRWFVSTLPLREATATAPAQIVPLDAAGRPIGAAVFDCSLSVVDVACEHAAGVAARRALEGHHG